MSAVMTIIDGNNWFRMHAETAMVGRWNGSILRRCFQELQSMQPGTIICWDGPNALARRRALVPEYKVRRNKPDDSFWESQKLFQDLVEFTHVTSVRIPGVEADDLIGAFVEQGLAQGLRKSDFLIMSNDADFLRLGVPMTRGPGKVPADQMLFYKVMVGDPSDCLSGASKFGEKAWSNTSPENRKLLEDIILGNVVFNADQVKEFYPKAGFDWFCVEDNRKLLKKYYDIISFMPVSDDDVKKYAKPGLNRPDLAEPIFAKLIV